MSTTNSPPMSAAEFRSIRERLGLSVEWIADKLARRDVKAVRRWEQGRNPIPAPARDRLLVLKQEADEFVDELVDDMTGEKDPVLETLPANEEGAGPSGLVYPATWHRAIAARVMEQVPQLRLVYPAQVDTDMIEVVATTDGVGHPKWSVRVGGEHVRLENALEHARGYVSQLAGYPVELAETEPGHWRISGS